MQPPQVHTSHEQSLCLTWEDGGACSDGSTNCPALPGLRTSCRPAAPEAAAAGAASWCCWLCCWCGSCQGGRQDAPAADGLGAACEPLPAAACCVWAAAPSLRAWLKLQVATSAGLTSPAAGVAHNSLHGMGNLMLQLVLTTRHSQHRNCQPARKYQLQAWHALIWGCWLQARYGRICAGGKPGDTPACTSVRPGTQQDLSLRGLSALADQKLAEDTQHLQELGEKHHHQQQASPSSTPCRRPGTAWGPASPPRYSHSACRRCRYL